MSRIDEKSRRQGVQYQDGVNKDIGSPFQPLSPEGKEILQSLVDNVHSQFVSAVAKGRGMNEAQVRNWLTAGYIPARRLKSLD